MKVLDLSCESGHTFEGWFESEQTYQSQRERNLIECPVCGSASVHKKLSAPRLNLLQAGMLQSMREMAAQTEDVGDLFAQEARKIHEGNAPARSIRGQASREEAVELLEDGIPVLPWLPPDCLKNPTH